jgi:ATP-dependent protease ClpP protease subunit
MSIEIRGVIVPSNYDLEWMAKYIEKGIVTPESTIRRQIAAADKKQPLELYINSPGGSVFAAYEIINTLAAWRIENNQPVNITIGAMAASAAAAISILSGANLKVFRNSKMMFHGAWTETVGGSQAHEDTADLLSQINADLKAALVGQYNVPVEKVEDWFAEGRAGWISAGDAFSYGMASEIVDSDDEEIEFIDGDIAGIEANGLAIAALVRNEAPEQIAPVEPAAVESEEKQDDGGKPANEAPAGAGDEQSASEPANDEQEPAADGAEPAKEEQPAAEQPEPDASVAGPDVAELVEIALQDRLAGHVAKNKELQDQLNAAIASSKHFQSLLCKEQAAREADTKQFETRLSAMADALKNANTRLSKLTLGSLSFSPVIETWPEALASCGGDYVTARKQHPEAYASYMQTNNKRR